MSNGKNPGQAATYGATVPYSNVNELLSAGGMMSGTGFTAVGSEGLVYLGPSYETRREPQAGDYVGSTVGSGNKQSAMVPVDVAVNRWYTLDDDERAEWYNISSEALGYNVGEKNPSQAQYKYNEYVNAASAYMKATGKPITPAEIAQQDIEFRRRMGFLKNQEGGGGGGGVRQVVSLTNPDDAKVLVDNALKQYLGRAANEEESAAFLSALNKVERQNPTTVGGSVQSGGTNRDLVAAEFARAQEGAAEFTAATQFTNWMLESIQGDVTEGIESGL